MWILHSRSQVRQLLRQTILAANSPASQWGASMMSSKVDCMQLILEDYLRQCDSTKGQDAYLALVGSL